MFDALVVHPKAFLERNRGQADIRSDQIVSQIEDLAAVDKVAREAFTAQWALGRATAVARSGLRLHPVIIQHMLVCPLMIKETLGMQQ